MNAPTPPIAIVGLGAGPPGAKDAGTFWRNILSGKDLLTDIPETHWLIADYFDPDPSAPDKIYAKRGGFLPQVDFDPLAYGIPPNNLPATDVTQLLALMVADSTLRDFAASRETPEFDRERVSVILGSGQLKLAHHMASRLERPVWLKSLREAGIGETAAQDICDRIASHYLPWQEATFPGVLMNVVAGRIANRFDLHGTNSVLDAACASALAAVSAAAGELATGACDMAITGGVDTINDQYMYMNFSKTPALSPTGDCRPFSADADGTMLGEALVMFAMKRLDDAERDGDQVYAVLRGVGSSSDGAGSAIYAPVPAGQARALRRAYERAGYGADTVELVEAHGTGTKAGDAAEFSALSTVFAEYGQGGNQWAALGSVKSQVGHTKSAAGAVGMLKALLALQAKILPPTIKVDQPNPKLAIAGSPLYVNTQARPWIRDSRHPRRASVSSFGFGGSNFHLTLEEYTGPRPAPQLRAMPAELVLLQADSPSSLVSAVETLSASAASLTAIARQSQLDFDSSAPARLAITAASRAELDTKLRAAIVLVRTNPAGPATAPGGIHYAAGPATPGDIAFLFPGQGSQYPGMGADLAMHLPPARRVWDRTAGIALGDLPLHRVVFPVPAFTDAERDEQRHRLTATEWAQPALATASLALLAVLSEMGIAATHAGGHSFGELVALHYGGVFDAETLVRLARHRGEAMRTAAAVPGVMTAVMAGAAETAAALAGIAPGQWWIANHNSPAQVVLSGTPAGITAAEDHLGAIGIRFRRLSTATAFHSPVVADASAPLRTVLNDFAFASPGLPVYGNADGDLYPAAAETIKDRVAEHLSVPVRFVEQVRQMYTHGARIFIEVGSGAAITQFVSQILGDQPHHAIALDHKDTNGVTALLNALGSLAVLGVKMDFGPLWHGYQQPQQPPTPSPRMTVPLTGASYAAPYPGPGGAPGYPPPNPDPAAAPGSQPAAAAPAAAHDQIGSTMNAPLPQSNPAIPAASASEWLTAFREIQHHAAAAHSAHQSALAEGYLGFLRSTEASVASLSALAGGAVPATGLPAAPPAPALPAPAPTLSPQPSAPPPAPALPAPGPATMAPAPPLGLTPPPVPATPAAAPPPSSAPDLAGVVLDVVVAKTGYPAEMLSADMALEADLGIDSIKRVEILSAVRERIPALPALDAAEVGKLGTLGQITELLQARGGGAAREPAAQQEGV